MKVVGKGLLCIVLLVLAGFCFSRFKVEYNRPDARSIHMAENDPTVDPAVPSVVPDPAAGAPTNAIVEAPSTNASPATNAVAAAAESTNAVAEVATNVAPGAARPVVVPGKAKAPGARVSGSGSASAYYLAGFVLSLVIFASIAAWEGTQWIAARSTRAMGADPLPAERDPLYEAAEAEWSKGNHLDAINMMRDYLKRHPSQQHVAIRIAEIYEKDLSNFLAAALELEDVLGKRLPREKWGWTAIHLANIYSGRLNQPDKAIATLERLAKEYPETAAARKARQRLGIPEPTEFPAGEMAATELPPAPSEPEDPGNLPQGFRSKKK